MIFSTGLPLTREVEWYSFLLSSEHKHIRFFPGAFKESWLPPRDDAPPSCPAPLIHIQQYEGERTAETICQAWVCKQIFTNSSLLDSVFSCFAKSLCEMCITRRLESLRLLSWFVENVSANPITCDPQSRPHVTLKVGHLFLFFEHAPGYTWGEEWVKGGCKRMRKKSRLTFSVRVIGLAKFRKRTSNGVKWPNNVLPNAFNDPSSCGSAQPRENESLWTDLERKSSHIEVWASGASI